MKMAKKTNWVPWVLLGGSAFLLIKMAKGVSGLLGTDGGYSGYVNPTFDRETGSFIAPTGETYTPSKDPIRALNYTPSITSTATTLRSMSQTAGRELTAKEILPVVKGMSPQDTKTAILLSSPKTLRSYSRVVAGTTKVTVSKKDSSGLTAFDRKIRSSKRYVGSVYK